MNTGTRRWLWMGLILVLPGQEREKAAEGEEDYDYEVKGAKEAQERAAAQEGGVSWVHPVELSGDSWGGVFDDVYVQVSEPAGGATRLRLRVRCEEEEMGQFAGEELQKGCIRLRLPVYGQEILEVSAVSESP